MRLSLYGNELNPICLFDSNLTQYESRELKLDVLPNVEDDFYQFTNLDVDQISISQFRYVARSICDIDTEVRISQTKNLNDAVFWTVGIFVQNLGP